MLDDRQLRWWLAAAVAVVSYFAYATGEVLGFSLGGTAWPYWPGCGFTVAVMILRPRSEWSIYLLAGISGELAYGGALSARALSLALANGLQCLVSAYLFTRFVDGRPCLDTPNKVTIFLAAGLVASLLAAAMALGFSTLLNNEFATNWFFVYFLLGGLLGIYVVTPAFLSYKTFVRWLRLRKPGLAAGFFGLLILEGLVAWYVFGTLPPAAFAPPLPYLVVPLVVAHAIAFGYGGAAASIAMVAFVSVTVTSAGQGPFGIQGAMLEQQIASLQIFLGALVVSTLYLGAYVTSRVHTQWQSARLQTELLHASGFAASARLARLLAHDVNNLLQIVSGSVQLRRWPSDIVPRVERISAQLSAFMRGTTENSVSKLFDPELCLLDLQEVLERLCGERIKLHLATTESENVVRGDPLQLDLCIVAVVQNAVDAMPDGGELRVTPGVVADGFVIDIEDTGPGVDATILPQLFEPFHTTKSGGTGFGLYAARQIMESMGGALTLHRNAPPGALFRLFLPSPEETAH